MRLIFFGTPAFAVPTLERLHGDPEHELVAVVSQPDRGRGRGRVRTPSPVSETAIAHGLQLLRPERVGEAEVARELAALEPELGVVVAFGQFLPRRIRELPSRGYLLNAHASLLPRHRGAAPIARAILAGDLETGISVMRVEREMDAGAVAATVRTGIAPEDDAGSLGERLAGMAADAIADALVEIRDGRVQWSEQDHALATSAPKIDAAEREIDWSEPADAIARRVRALAPEPGARSRIDGDPLRILAARAEPAPLDRAPGHVALAPGSPLRVATGEGWLLPERVQRAGGRVLDVETYLRGRPIPDGARLGG